ncbi:RNA polymerase-binding protein RbpA [Actinokineospora sp. HUAS TT18]|uniref:RNA polymerase-binding protein RbpA n=1 Tax=Actinokineospora sp. HUAS TT18 TaxID=3447451 RepID=UPI003F523E9A
MRATRPGQGGRAEPDRGDGLAARVTVDDRCPGGRGHTLPIVFARTAEPPSTWTCPHHGLDATRPTPADSALVEQVLAVATAQADASAQVRTPWVMLRERRTLRRAGGAAR